MTRFFGHGQSILQVFETSIALSMVKSVKSPFFQTLLVPISWTLAIMILVVVTNLKDFVSPFICLPPGGLSLAVEGPSKAEITCTDNKDGTCSVQYLPTAPGEYSIIIKFADKHISGSPFTANVIGPGM